MRKVGKSINRHHNRLLKILTKVKSREWAGPLLKKVFSFKLVDQIRFEKLTMDQKDHKLTFLATKTSQSRMITEKAILFNKN